MQSLKIIVTVLLPLYIYIDKGIIFGPQNYRIFYFARAKMSISLEYELFYAIMALNLLSDNFISQRADDLKRVTHRTRGNWQLN